MNLKTSALVWLFLSSFFGFAQHNDSLFYKSGMIRQVEIDSANVYNVYFKYINRKGKMTVSKINRGSLKQYKRYDSNDSLIYNSSLYPDPHKNRENLSIAKHTFSVNPIALLALVLNTRYNYVFGNNMHWAINGRFTYLRPFIYDLGDYGGLFLGCGIKFIPHYSERMSLGIDITPTVVMYLGDWDEYPLLLPLSFNFDFYRNPRIGFTFDVGAGLFIDGGDLGLLSRSHFGLLWRFKDRKTIKNPILYPDTN